MQQTKVKPFIKWAGGKTQLLKTFQSFYPKQLKEHKIRNYYEPFLGSGAVFFDVVQQFNIRNAFLYDLNQDLILTYKVIQQNVSGLLDFLFQYQKFYDNCPKGERAELYYKERAAHNEQRPFIDYKHFSKTHLSRAAQFVFLNKTCFNGLYRTNSKGNFNSPFGYDADRRIYNEENVLNASKLLGIAEIRAADFGEVMKDLKESSFVYFDPPYRPISETESFNAYQSKGFDDAEQVRLASVFKALHRKGAKLMLSNSDPKNKNAKDHFFEKLYSGFNIFRVNARRTINSKAARRGTIKEILVTNYKPKQD
jgi:DNA adenine methylase